MIDRVKGPVSYFPSIKKTCSQPMHHWFEQIADMPDQSQVQLTGYLKDAHMMGNCHTNAAVGHQHAVRKGN